jgi:hypothetical protein
MGPLHLTSVPRTSQGRFDFGFLYILARDFRTFLFVFPRPPASFSGEQWGDCVDEKNAYVAMVQGRLWFFKSIPTY